ncbi:MAG: peptidase S41 [Spirochaetae bacterium HGW-Spirochaetae-7]|jgi:carboxyl-terminal processing protease|nr:MAG: peptidase S41 [Spirochaetae bacterium HGW-Spirochaetae-7]
MIDHNDRGHDRKAWGVVALVAVFCTALSFSAPAAYAQDAKAESQRYFSIFQSAFNFILENYVDNVDPKVLYEGAMQGMFESLGDPYSVFLTDAMMNDLNDTTTGRFGGIGLYISKPLPDPKLPERRLYVEIVSPIEDTPGWRAGIMPGDQITHIDGETTEPLSMDEVLKRLRGEPGSTVTITILRGAGLVFDEKVTRAMIEVPTVKRAMLPGGVGYLRIIEFTPQTISRVREAIDWFAAQRYKSLVVDLRNNPGGLLQSVIQVADLFLKEGVIVSTKSRNRYENAVYQAKPDLLVPAGMHVVVMINRGSASASEILAGALKDQKRAYLVGENSYGKGSVQQVLPLGDTGFKLTMSRYYTPSDANIDKVGIAPDLAVKEPELTPEEEASLSSLIQRNVFGAFATANPNASPQQIDQYVQGLRSAGSPVSERVLKKMLRNQLERTSIGPIFDLDFDLQLNAALKAIADDKFMSLISEALSVKDLQMAHAETAAADKTATAASGK